MRRYAKRNSANNASIPMSMPALSSPVRHDDPPESEFTQDAITDPAPATQEVAEIAGGYPQVPSRGRENWLVNFRRRVRLLRMR